jgi:hypothetical protein
VTIGKNNGDEADPSGYGNLPFVFFQPLNLQIGGLIRVPMFMYVLTCHCSLLTRGHDLPPS